MHGSAISKLTYPIVLPLSAYHTKIALPHILDVALLMVMVGLPIALIVRKYPH